MKKAMMAVLLIASSLQARAHSEFEQEKFNTKPILADLRDLRALNIPTLAHDEEVGVGYAVISPLQQVRLQERAHKVGKCGGFEDLTHDSLALSQGSEGLFSAMKESQQKNSLYNKIPFKPMNMVVDAKIQSALNEVSEANLRSYVQWLSSFPTRNGTDSRANVHVTEMHSRLEAMLSGANLPYQIDEISHSSTQQKTLRVRLIGSTRPNEVIVLGGHLDSINQSWGGGKSAPGADDNASGSANLIEALRILLAQPQPQRSIEFFWYAGEENGLLGSAEIAKNYKAQKVDVIAVLQLDMTLFPGAGEFVIGSMTDFTSAWLRDYLKSVNDTYLHARIVDDQCGYGCSDHASWSRQGYPALMPFETTFRGMNKNIHTSRDVITPESNFKHSMLYSKIALVMAMDLGNSSARQPF